LVIDNSTLDQEATEMGNRALQMAINPVESSQRQLQLSVGSHAFQRQVNNTAIVQFDDSVESIVLDDEPMGDVKEDVDIAMEKVIARIKAWARESEAVGAQLENIGRDAWVYRGFFKRNQTLMQHVDAWSDKWSVKKTCGLLLDLGNALRRLCPDEDRVVMNDVMADSRGDNHAVDPDSQWATEFNSGGAKVQSGVSATTGNLLRTLRHLDVTTTNEIEAIMIGVVKYWKDGSLIKRIRGEFHTASEVWAAYMYHLEKTADD